MPRTEDGNLAPKPVLTHSEPGSGIHHVAELINLELQNLLQAPRNLQNSTLQDGRRTLAEPF